MGSGSDFVLHIIFSRKWEVVLTLTLVVTACWQWCHMGICVSDCSVTLSTAAAATLACCLESCLASQQMMTMATNSIGTAYLIKIYKVIHLMVAMQPLYSSGLLEGM